jgi:hypothetical protein
VHDVENEEEARRAEHVDEEGQRARRLAGTVPVGLCHQGARSALAEHPFPSKKGIDLVTRSSLRHGELASPVETVIP